MKKCKWLVAMAVMAGCVFGASALSVNENEIKSTGSEVVEFNSYSGPHALIESAASITEIGGNLGRQVAIDLNQAGAYGLNTKYSVIHAIDSSEGSKMDADILVINEDATVDHITNLRRIIAGYLIEAYGYNANDASTIATFITVYNAVYRQNLSVFNTKYKSVVTRNLTEEDCGLSTNWSDWPGNTQIVIPLFDMSSSLSAVDTSVISDKKVIASIKEEDDLGVDERKNLADIKQREATDYSNKAQEAAQTAAQQNRQLAQQQEAANKASENAAQAVAQAAANPDDQELQKKAQEAQALAQTEKEKAEAQKQQTEQAQKDAEKAQAVADKKLAESTTERTEIAKDKQKLLSQALAAEQDRNAAIGMIIVDDKKQLASLVKIDSTTGNILSQSPVKAIHGRTVIPVSEGTGSKAKTIGFVAVCNESTATNSAVRLCYIDSQSLEIQAQSKEIVYQDSVLVEDGNYYFCVIKSGSSYYIAKYDSDMNLIQKSTATVKNTTPITVTDKGIIATSSANKIILLNTDTLAAVSQ
ncbi:MAG: hypothetical protein J6Y69_08340 [Treponema sp.]|nr:hypothetical protein [Treponema sp.]